MFWYVLFFMIMHSNISADIPYSCPRSTTLFVRNICFWTINAEYNFNQSHRRCRDNGGILGEIPDQHVEEAILRKYRYLFQKIHEFFCVTTTIYWRYKYRCKMAEILPRRPKTSINLSVINQLIHQSIARNIRKLWVFIIRSNNFKRLR